MQRFGTAAQPLPACQRDRRPSTSQRPRAVLISHHLCISLRHLAIVSNTVRDAEWHYLIPVAAMTRLTLGLYLDILPITAGPLHSLPQTVACAGQELGGRSFVLQRHAHASWKFPAGRVHCDKTT